MRFIDIVQYSSPLYVYYLLGLNVWDRLPTGSLRSQFTGQPGGNRSACLSSSRCWFWHWLFWGDSVSQDLISSGLLPKSKYFVNCQAGNCEKMVLHSSGNLFGSLFQLSMPLNDTKGVLWAVKESEVPSWAIYCQLIIGYEKQCDVVGKG